MEATVWMRRHKEGNFLFESTPTKSDGHFRFSNVEAGIVTFTAIANDHSFSGTHLSVQEGQIERSLILVATQPSRLELNIRDVKGGPVAGAELARISWTLPEKSRYWLPLEVLDLSQLERPKSYKEGVLLVERLRDRLSGPRLVWH